MTRKAVLVPAAAFACACICGCYGGGKPPAGTSSRYVFAQSTRTYVLGREPDQERERAFHDLLAAAHAKALKKIGPSFEAGVSYSMSPKGIVYPFSEAEVVCLVRKADHAEGKTFCKEFFKAVDAGFAKVVAPR